MPPARAAGFECVWWFGRLAALDRLRHRFGCGSLAGHPRANAADHRGYPLVPHGDPGEPRSLLILVELACRRVVWDGRMWAGVGQSLRLVHRLPDQGAEEVRHRGYREPVPLRGTGDSALEEVVHFEGIRSSLEGHALSPMAVNTAGERGPGPACRCLAVRCTDRRPLAAAANRAADDRDR